MDLQLAQRCLPRRPKPQHEDEGTENSLHGQGIEEPVTVHAIVENQNKWTPQRIDNSPCGNFMGPKMLGTKVYHGISKAIGNMPFVPAESVTMHAIVEDQTKWTPQRIGNYLCGVHPDDPNRNKKMRALTKIACTAVSNERRVKLEEFASLDDIDIAEMLGESGRFAIIRITSRTLKDFCAWWPSLG